MPRKVLVWLLRPTGEALLFRRARSVSVPGWHPITGNVDEAEDLAVAAAREVLEETGLSVVPVALGLSTEFERYGKRLVEHAFAALVPEGDPVLSEEHDAFEWVPPAEAARRVAFPFQREALAAAARRIGRPI